MEIDKKLFDLRRQHRLSRDELAGKIGVSRQSVSKWELGAAVPSISNIEKLSEVFGVSTAFLLGREEQKEAQEESIKKVIEKATEKAIEKTTNHSPIKKAAGKKCAAIVMIVSLCFLVLLSVMSQIFVSRREIQKRYNGSDFSVVSGEDEFENENYLLIETIETKGFAPFLSSNNLEIPFLIVVLCFCVSAVSLFKIIKKERKNDE